MTSDALLADYLAGDLSENEAQQLLHLVRSDPTMGARLVALARFDRELRSEIAPIAIAERIRKELADDDELYTRRVVREVRRQSARRNARQRFFWPAAVGLVAAAVLLVLGMHFLATSPEPRGASEAPAEAALPRPIGPHSTGPLRLERDGRSRLVPAGTSLSDGDRIEAIDPTGLALPDRSQVELSSGTVLRLTQFGDAGKLLDLEQGRLRAEITKQPPGRPMRINAPHLSATVIGTRLELSASATQARLAVVEGRVQVKDSTGPAVDIITGGWAVAVAGAPLETGFATRDGLWSIAGHWAECVTSGTLVRDQAGQATGAVSIAVLPEQTSTWFKPDQIICIQNGELGSGGPLLVRLPQGFVISLRIQAERSGRLAVTMAEPKGWLPVRAGFGAKELAVASGWNDLELTAKDFHSEDPHLLTADHPLGTISIWGFATGPIAISGFTVRPGTVP